MEHFDQVPGAVFADHPLVISAPASSHDVLVFRVLTIQSVFPAVHIAWLGWCELPQDFEELLPGFASAWESYYSGLFVTWNHWLWRRGSYCLPNWHPHVGSKWFWCLWTNRTRIPRARLGCRIQASQSHVQSGQRICCHRVPQICLIHMWRGWTLDLVFNYVSYLI